MGNFIYGTSELSHLRARDSQLAWAIDKMGMIERAVQPDLFTALIKSIVGQQISTKAQQTIWKRMLEGFGGITPEIIATCTESELQGFGITYKKAGYMQNVAKTILNGNLNLEELRHLQDDEVCEELSKLPGIGVWTAEMLMIFSMQRPDVVSYGDLAILRGMRMLYHHRKITKKLFDKYRKRYSPYGSVASLYLWAIAGGQIEGMKDCAPKNQRITKTKE